MRIIKRDKFNIIAVLALYIAIFGLFLEAEAFTVNPGRIEIIMPAGESYRGSYIIGNPGNTAVKIRISAEDWSSAEDGRNIEKGDNPSLDWLTFMPQEVELGPNESKTVQYVIKMPKEAKGEYNAMIYFGEVLPPSKAGISVRSRIGNAIYVIIRGTEVIGGKISEISIFGKDPLRVDVAVENTGNIHIRPKGKIKIIEKGRLLSERDRDRLEIPFNDAGFPVLPQQVYAFETRIKEPLGVGRYRLELDMEYDKAKFKAVREFSITKEGEVKIQQKNR